MEQTGEMRKRNVAYKITIGDILSGQPVYEGDRLQHITAGNRSLVRVNILANCIDKFVTDQEDKKYATLTVDDASGQIRLKVFGEDVSRVADLMQGDTLQIIGTVRIWNDEVYLTPEVVKKVDPRWLLVRKLEIQAARKTAMPMQTTQSADKDGTATKQDNMEHTIRQEVMQKIKDAEVDGGVDIDTLIMGSSANPDIINAAIKKLLEEGLIYEPRPGRLRYLG